MMTLNYLFFFFFDKSCYTLKISFFKSLKIFFFKYLILFILFHSPSSVFFLFYFHFIFDCLHLCFPPVLLSLFLIPHSCPLLILHCSHTLTVCHDLFFNLDRKISSWIIVTTNYYFTIDLLYISFMLKFSIPSA